MKFNFMEKHLEKTHLVNHQIRASRIMLLDKEGQKIGEMTLREAMQKASENELDIMQVGENQGTAICKMLNYESWLYHENKRKQKQEFKNRSHELKSMNFRPVTGEHDFQLKLKKVGEFLEENHKVKIVIKFKNYRESTMKPVNDEVVQKILDSVQEVGLLDGKVNANHKEMNFILKPAKKPTPKMKP